MQGKRRKTQLSTTKSIAKSFIRRPTKQSSKKQIGSSQEDNQNCLLKKLAIFNNNLKEAIISLNPTANFDANLPLSLDFDILTSNCVKVPLYQNTKLSDILEMEYDVDSSLIGCLQKLNKISFCLKEKALKSGILLYTK